MAVAAGPVVGGIVTEALDWHWIFWFNLPIGILAVVLATRLLPESHGAPERLDLPGVALVTAGVVSVVWALVRANNIGWSRPEIVGTIIVDCGLLVAFVAHERRAREPMVPTRMFRNRPFAVGNAGLTAVVVAVWRRSLAQVTPVRAPLGSRVLGRVGGDLGLAMWRDGAIRRQRGTNRRANQHQVHQPRRRGDEP